MVEKAELCCNVDVIYDFAFMLMSPQSLFKQLYIAQLGLRDITVCTNREICLVKADSILRFASVPTYRSAVSLIRRFVASLPLFPYYRSAMPFRTKQTRFTCALESTKMRLDCFLACTKLEMVKQGKC
jgi:hypothetical protein